MWVDEGDGNDGITCFGAVVHGWVGVKASQQLSGTAASSEEGVRACDTSKEKLLAQSKLVQSPSCMGSACSLGVISQPRQTVKLERLSLKHPHLFVVEAPGNKTQL